MQFTVESVKCPECGSVRLIRDGATGEVVCAACGLVVNEVEIVQDFAPKSVDRGSFAVVGSLGSGKPTPSEIRRGGRFLRMVGRCEERTEYGAATTIETIADKIVAPKQVRETATGIAKRLIRAMREKGRKLRVEEIAAVSMWCACKLAVHPVTMDEYAVVVEPYISRKNGGKQSLLKLLNKADTIMPLPGAALDARTYIVKFAGKLERRVNPKLVSDVMSYAIKLYEEAADDVSGKDPVCTAATALCVADELFGGWIGRKRIFKLTRAGFSQSVAKAMKGRASLPPGQLLNKCLRSKLKRVMEVKTYEKFGNGGNRERKA